MVQTFCRHNRFIQRCPICRETLPGAAPVRRTGTKATDRGGSTAAKAARGAGVNRPLAGRSRHGGEVHVRHEARFTDDGFRSELVPGLRSSHDAQRLVEEIGFASGRLLALTAAPPGVYGEARACDDIEQASWMCFLTAYLSPLQGSQPFAGIRQALTCSWRSARLPDLTDVPLGPRTSHDAARGSETLQAYRRFAEHAGSQERAFVGEPSWTPQRRFERVFERLALPGFGRVGRYELLIAFGRLGLYEMRADSLHLGTRVAKTGADALDHTLEAAKRVFGIGDPMHLERRAKALAEAISTPIEALDLALWNWSPATGEERVTLGVPASTRDAHAVERALDALEL
jgi:hypothetical protein